MALFPKVVVGANVVARQSSPRFACSSEAPILGLSSAWFVVLLEAVPGAAFSGVCSQRRFETGVSQSRSFRDCRSCQGFG